MFFRKATDAEARAWLSRKQVVAWGIINELSLEIERLDAQTVKDDQEIQALQSMIEQIKEKAQLDV